MMKQRHPFAALRIVTVLGCLVVGTEMVILGGLGTLQAQVASQGSQVGIPKIGEAQLHAAPLLAVTPSYGTQFMVGLLVILLGLAAHLFFLQRDKSGNGQKSVSRINARRLEVYQVEL